MVVGREESDERGRGRRGCSAETASSTLKIRLMVLMTVLLVVMLVLVLMVMLVMVLMMKIKTMRIVDLQVLARGEGLGAGFDERGDPGDEPGD